MPGSPVRCVNTEGIPIDPQPLQVNLYPQTKLNSASSSHKALALLIREKAIDLPEISIIEALINKNESSIEFIQRSTGLRNDLVVQVVKGLASRGLLDFIEDSGAIKVKEMITL